ncbi:MULTISPECIES: TetR/AcrR family transcriptional regulator [Amycolatopsis]|uniref:TetR/AcrR family transcriptional regulator n=1 Tax=Amycolatopsis TaxID=1813 RepID=UPI001F271563|nr:TetR/AcrR family transcriptional regulator [Amycolatopsis tucumanensis]MCF6422655.1 TetR/AcrR family transcriptional regulator [Amycolatopsis tucumanensis]
MARLTRAESQAHTRRRLLDTATELFLREGYTGTSLERVAEEAGYSKGAVYSNFRNKDELCLAVLEGVRAEKAASVDATLAGTDSLEELLAAFAVWAAGTGGDQEWIRLEAEYLLNCRRDPELLGRLAKSNAEIADLVTGLLNTNARRLGVRLPMDARQAAYALFSITLGLGLLRSVDPGIGVDSFTSIVRLLAQPAEVKVPEARSASREPADGADSATSRD